MIKKTIDIYIYIYIFFWLKVPATFGISSLGVACLGVMFFWNQDAVSIVLGSYRNRKFRRFCAMFISSVKSKCDCVKSAVVNAITRYK